MDGDEVKLNNGAAMTENSRQPKPDDAVLGGKIISQSMQQFWEVSCYAFKLYVLDGQDTHLTRNLGLLYLQFR